MDASPVGGQPPRWVRHRRLMPNGTIDEASAGIRIEPVRDVRVHVRIPTPPILATVFYAAALLAGLAIGAAAGLMGHVGA